MPLCKNKYYIKKSSVVTNEKYIYREVTLLTCICVTCPNTSWLSNGEVTLNIIIRRLKLQNAICFMHWVG